MADGVRWALFDFGAGNIVSLAQGMSTIGRGWLQCGVRNDASTPKKAGAIFEVKLGRRRILAGRSSPLRG